MAAAARKEIARDCQTGVFVFMHIHTRLDARIHSNGAEYFGIVFLLSFTERHVYKLLLRPSKRDSCLVPLPPRGKEC